MGNRSDQLTRDLALIILAGVTVVTVGASVTALAITGKLAIAAAATIITALVAVATGAIGRLSGTGVVNNNNT